MKKFFLLFLLFFLCTGSLVFSANVYFDQPVNNSHHMLNVNGSVGVSYHMLTVHFFFIVDSYQARVQYPNGTWSAWQIGQSGGWVFTEAGTYHIQGRVHVDYDLSGQSNYWMYSNILTFYVDEYTPPAPLSATMSGPSSVPNLQWGTWVVTPYGGTPPYTYDWSYFIHCNALPRTSGDKGGGTEAAPCNYWRNTSNYTNTTTRMADGRDFTEKCIVKDADNSTYIVTKYISSSSSRPTVQNSEFEEEFNTDINGTLSKTKAQNSEFEGESTIDISSPLSKPTVQNSEFEEELTTESLSSYPNPFNPSSKINVVIPNSGMVSLKIYDILGTEVAVLVDEVMAAGKYEFEFNASRLPSGTYISALSTKNGLITQKLLLVK